VATYDEMAEDFVNKVEELDELLGDMFRCVDPYDPGDSYYTKKVVDEASPLLSDILRKVIHMATLHRER